MLNKKNKPGLKTNGNRNPYLIQIDSKGVIMNANDQFEALLSSNSIPHFLHQNIDSVFKQLGTAHHMHLKQFPEYEDMHLDEIGMAIRWYAKPLPEEQGKSGWQLTGLEMNDLVNDSILRKSPGNLVLKEEAQIPIKRTPRVKLPPRESRKSFGQYVDQITQILDSITDGFFMLDKEFHITMFNSKAENTLKCTAGKMIGRSAMEVLPELIDITVYKAMLKAFKRKSVFSGERSLPRLGLCLELNTQSFAQGMFVYIRDITRRKKHELLLELEKKVLEINSNQNATLGWGLRLIFFWRGLNEFSRECFAM